MRRIAGWVDHTDIVDFNGETSTLIAVWGPDPDSARYDKSECPRREEKVSKKRGEEARTPLAIDSGKGVIILR